MKKLKSNYEMSYDAHSNVLIDNASAKETGQDQKEEIIHGDNVFFDETDQNENDNENFIIY